MTEEYNSKEYDTFEMQVEGLENEIKQLQSKLEKALKIGNELADKHERQGDWRVKEIKKELLELEG